jgi:hypothetical protein
MPRSILEAYVKAAPAVRAQQSLQRIRDYQLGSGNVKPTVLRRALRDIQREARQGYTRRSARPKSPEQAAYLMASMGIGVHVSDTGKK